MSDFSSIRPNIAVQNAYGQAKDLKSTQAIAEDGAEKASSFGDMLREAAQQSVDTIRTGDETATAGLAGKVGIQQVVEATMAMESTVQVSVAVRDKVVEAYQEIIRMQI